jgi:predicted GIY-YIG superfamily endonuclease/predicted DNA-binding protein YlxM (UPF0122 family)
MAKEKLKTRNRKHFCYLIINSINNKIYIGVTYKPINDRFKEHIKVSRFKSSKNKQALHLAIDKYGARNFSISLIKEFETYNEAYEAEKGYISQYNSTNNKIGYNQSKGGDCGPIKIKLDSSVVIQVIEDYCNKLSLQEIADKHNLTRYRVFDITKLRISPNHNIPAELLERLKQAKFSSKKRKKVTEDIVRQILLDFSLGEMAMSDIADKYDLSTANARSIIRRETFTEVIIDQDIIDKVNQVLSAKKFWKKSSDPA